MTRRAVPGSAGLRAGASLVLLLLLAPGVGCVRKPSPAPAVGTPRVGVMGMPSTAAPPAPVVETFNPDSSSTVAYASLEAVRDTVERLLRQAVNLADSAIHVSRDTVTFQPWTAKTPVRGWAVRVVVNDASGCPVDALEGALWARGWAGRYRYSSDGADGTSLGMVSRDFFCLIEGAWEGGDESDTTVVPRPGCTVTATCVRRFADDARSP